MGKQVYLEDLFKNTKDCYGWAWHLKGRRYTWHNDNDLGLLGEDWDAIRELGCKETILRKVKVTKNKYLYILRNVSGYTESELKDSATIPTIKALLKESHGLSLTKHEMMLVTRHWKQFF